MTHEFMPSQHPHEEEPPATESSGLSTSKTSDQILFNRDLFVFNEDPTFKQMLVLDVLVRNKGEICSSEEIYREVWRDTASEDIPNLVGVTVHRLRKKIDRPQNAIETIILYGYRLNKTLKDIED